MLCSNNTKKYNRKLLVNAPKASCAPNVKRNVQIGTLYKYNELIIPQ